MYYQIQFLLVADGRVIKTWECRDNFRSREYAMEFAQTICRGMKNSGMTIYYRIFS